MSTLPFQPTGPRSLWISNFQSYVLLFPKHILADRRQTTELHGQPTYTEQCTNATRQRNKPEVISPLKDSSYVVAFHRNHCVRMLGFSGQDSAMAFYEVLSRRFAKVLTDRPYSRVGISHHTLIRSALT